MRVMGKQPMPVNESSLFFVRPFWSLDIGALTFPSLSERRIDFRTRWWFEFERGRGNPCTLLV